MVEALPLEEQEMLIEIIRQRLREQRRKDLMAEVYEARQAYRAGEVHRVIVSDIMKELAE